MASPVQVASSLMPPSAGPELRPAPPPMAPKVLVPVAGGTTSEGSSPLVDAVQSAGRGLFADREIETASFFDEATSRHVFRIADKFTGEILMQSPPEAILRLWADLRRPETAPLVAVTA